METKNCPRCGKLFQYINSPICDLCRKEEEEAFESLKSFLKDNPGCTLTEISVATGVSTRKITRYLKEGRLEITKGLHGVLTCNECGKTILTGRYCPQCLLKISVDIKEMRSTSHTKPDTGGKKSRMYTAEDR